MTLTKGSVAIGACNKNSNLKVSSKSVQKLVTPKSQM
jgi:hypothetical protein